MIECASWAQKYAQVAKQNPHKNNEMVNTVMVKQSLLFRKQSIHFYWANLEYTIFQWVLLEYILLLLLLYRNKTAIVIRAIVYVQTLFEYFLIERF